MKKIRLLVLLTAVLAGCADDDSIEKCEPTLVTPKLFATVQNNDTQSPLTGILSIYPCQQKSALFYGNYVSGQLTPLQAYYAIKDGILLPNAKNRELSLPIGTYNLLYWGTPQYEEPIYAHPALKEPGIAIGSKLSDLRFGLFKIPADTTYYPTFDLVFAVIPTKIGTDHLSASLTRAVAGLKVIVLNKNNSILSSSIDSMYVHITNISTGLNFFTGKADPQRGTVTFPLVRSIDGTQMSNATVMLFPSVGKPVFKLFILLKNGTTKIVQQTLNAALNSNVKLTLTLTLGDIFSEDSSGAFTIDNWYEESQVIDVPFLN